MPHELAGKPAPKERLIDIAALEKAYYQTQPDISIPEQRVAFGTSGHRGSSLNGSFTEMHIVAITQAIVEYRRSKQIDGPLYIGKDTHALSAAAQRTALEVLAANAVHIRMAANDGYTPTPVISHAILSYNAERVQHYADGIVITPSHNPPADGGFKYNAINGGPADTEVTNWIEKRANELLATGNRQVRRRPYESVMKANTALQYDFITPYVNDLQNVIYMDALRASGARIGVDPLGGAAVGYWQAIAERYDLHLTVVNDKVDPTFSFMTVDHDGKIRMDCSSPYAMAGLVGLKDKFDIAFGNDPDSDRHGIVAPSCGLLNPNHFLAVAIRYLLRNRPQWSTDAAIGKTLVSSGIIDRLVSDLGRKLYEVPVGFKWFSRGLHDGRLCFGGEESAGASFVRRNGSVWTTDKDGPLLGLLACEITARTGKDPGQHYQELTAKFGSPLYKRIDAPATPAQKAKLKDLSPEDVADNELAGEKITSKLTQAPGNNASIGGLKVCTQNGWFAARPSGTEDVYKIYAESFKGEAHLQLILEQAQTLVTRALG